VTIVTELHLNMPCSPKVDMAAGRKETVSIVSVSLPKTLAGYRSVLLDVAIDPGGKNQVRSRKQRIKPNFIINAASQGKSPGIPKTQVCFVGFHPSLKMQYRIDVNVPYLILVRIKIRGMLVKPSSFLLRQQLQGVGSVFPTVSQQVIQIESVGLGKGWMGFFVSVQKPDDSFSTKRLDPGMKGFGKKPLTDL
jgi:hypothetical protein